MKGLVVALLAFGLLVVLAVVLLRHYRGTRYFMVLLRAWGASQTVYAVLYWLAPADLGVLPGGWLEPSAALDFLNGVLILVLLFHSFWDALYTTVLTGFSGNLMVLLDRRGGLTTDDILVEYGARDRLDRVLAWRLPKLLNGGYLAADGDGYRLRPKGLFIGTVARYLKRALTGAEAGG